MPARQRFASNDERGALTVLWSRPGALEAVSKASLLVLDIDGVLLDPRPSFYAAARTTASWAAERILGRSAGEPISDADIAAFKSVGGWNDDFDLACGCAWALVVREAGPRHLVSETASRVGGGLSALEVCVAEHLPAELLHRGRQICPTPLIRQRAAATYAGLERCLDMYGIDPVLHEGVPHRGLWPLEPALCEAELLRQVPLPLAFFTGRNLAEAALALERFELSVPLPRQIVDDGVTPKKPAADGLIRLAEQIAGTLVFVGDSIDDQRAALTFRSLDHSEIVFVRVLGPDAPAAAVEQARTAGADIIVSSLDALLRTVWKEAAR